MADQFSRDGAAVQISAGREDHSPAAICCASSRGNGNGLPVLCADLHHFCLLDAEILLHLKSMLHDLLIAPAVGLGAEGIDSRPLSEIQHAVLDTDLVCGFCHLSAQSVQLPYQMPFPGASYGGIAWHVPHAVKVDCETDCIHSKPSSGQ